MREDEYRQWLVDQGFDGATISTQLSQARRLDRSYGDLDSLLPQDGLVELQRQLTYSKEDERAGRPNPANFPIDGNIYNSLASYRQSLEKYRQFAASGQKSSQPAGRRLTRPMVDAALDEYDRSGEAGFMLKYDRGLQGLRYWLQREGRDYPSKAIANAAFEIGFGICGSYDGTQARQQLVALGYTIIAAGTEPVFEVAEPSDRSLPAPNNLILYGPPGTGKTYATASEAVRLCDGTAPRERAELMARYEELRAQKRISFVTFHQSYDYESFVEGLRPETADDGGSAGFRLEAKSGVFREICALAEQSRQQPSPNDEETALDLDKRRFWKMGQGAVGSEEEVYEAALAGNYITLGWGGAIDWSAPIYASIDAIKAEWQSQHPADTTPSNWSQSHTFRTEMQIGDLVIVPFGNSAFRAVAEITGDYYFEPSAEGHYAHRRKVNWLLVLDDPLPLDTIIEGNFTMRTLYAIANKRINRAALSRLLTADAAGKAEPDAALPPDQFVLIIDEINRANVSKVFGELITLIEPDKRLGMPNAITVRLPYSKRDFGVPHNLHIIGTMNTADRSIALLDTALRRRFQFRELAPDPSRLPELVDGIPCRLVLEVINDRLEYLIDRDHRIGHAFFMGEGGGSRAAIDTTMRNKVIPLLQEYFFDDWSRLAAVLGDTGSKGGAFLECRLLADPSGSGGDPRPSWRVRETFAPDAYDRLVRSPELIEP